MCFFYKFKINYVTSSYYVVQCLIRVHIWYVEYSSMLTVPFVFTSCIVCLCDCVR